MSQIVLIKQLVKFAWRATPLPGVKKSQAQPYVKSLNHSDDNVWHSPGRPSQLQINLPRPKGRGIARFPSQRPSDDCID